MRVATARATSNPGPDAGAVTGIINVAVGMLNATGIVVQLIIEAIGGLASLFGSNPGFPPFTPSTIPLLDPSAFEEACVVLPRECAGVDTPGRLFQLALTPVASDSGICGFFRYIVRHPARIAPASATDPFSVVSGTMGISNAVSGGRKFVSDVSAVSTWNWTSRVLWPKLYMSRVVRLRLPVGVHCPGIWDLDSRVYSAAHCAWVSVERAHRKSC